MESNGEYCEEVYVRQNSGIDYFNAIKASVPEITD